MATILDAPGCRPVTIISAYLVDGEGLSAQNLHILAEVGKCATGQGEGVQHIIGGNFNMQHGVLATSGIDQLAQATIVFPKSSKGTYRSGGANSCLDYFIVFGPMAECVEEVAIEELTGLKGHVPVSVCFAPQLTAQKALRIRKPPKIPPQRIIGPLRQVKGWERARKAVINALAIMKGEAKYEAASQAIENAYVVWVKLAGQELIEPLGLSWRKRAAERKSPERCGHLCCQNKWKKEATLPGLCCRLRKTSGNRRPMSSRGQGARSTTCSCLMSWSTASSAKSHAGRRKRSESS